MVGGLFLYGYDHHSCPRRAAAARGPPLLDLIMAHHALLRMGIILVQVASRAHGYTPEFLVWP